MTLIGRDPFGETPAYYAIGQELGEPEFVHGVTMAECHEQGASYQSIRLLPPGTSLSYINGQVTTWTRHTPHIEPCDDDRATATEKVHDLLLDACRRAAPQAAVAPKAAVLLSGGIDSAAVAYGLLEAGVSLTAYTAVFNERSPDLKSARQIANHLDLKLIEVPVPPPSLNDIPETIRIIEQPWKAQVEIGYPCLHLAAAIAADGHTLVYSGEGSDELWGSHAFTWRELRRPGAPDFHTYRARDFHEQAYRNFVREHHTFHAHGLTARSPFLWSTQLVDYVLSLTQPVCQDNSWQAKRPLQEAFKPHLPEWVGRRQKLGFQDGLGIKSAFNSIIPTGYTTPAVYYREIHRRIFGTTYVDVPKREKP